MNALTYFLDRTKKRIVWSWQGCLDCWRTQHSFRSWVWAYIVMAIVAFVLPLTGGERALVLSLGVLVLASEAMNTAIEHTVDYISTEHHDLAGRAKDAASAAVFLTSLAAGLAWIMTLVSLWQRWG